MLWGCAVHLLFLLCVWNDIVFLFKYYFVCTRFDFLLFVVVVSKDRVIGIIFFSNQSNVCFMRICVFHCICAMFNV